MPKYGLHQCAAPGCTNMTTNEKYCSESCSGRGRAHERQERDNRTPKPAPKSAWKICPNKQCLGRGSWIENSGPPNVNGESTPERKYCPDCGGVGKIPPE